MEVNKNQNIGERFREFFLKKEGVPFVRRKEVDWKIVRKYFAISLGVGLLFLLLLPNSPPESKEFREQSDLVTSGRVSSVDPARDVVEQFESGQRVRDSVPRDLGYLMATAPASPSGGASDRNSVMVVTRGGDDARTQVPPGARIPIRLVEKAIVAGQSMPVVGNVLRDFVQEGEVAVPKGSKLFGEISFESDSERARVDWRTIQFPDGRMRPISAIGVSSDGQVGVEGKIHSEAMKNVVGQTLTRFIAAYAEGSMQRGAMGGNPGGHENGLKNAVSETAKDRADAWAEDLKKEKRWIEVDPQMEFLAILTGSFRFREPGATYGGQ